MPIRVLANHKKKLTSTESGGFWRNRLVRWWAWQKAKSIEKKLSRWIEGRRILDVGMGFGVVAEFFKRRDYEITGVDVVDMSMYEDIRPIIYNGTKLPLGDKSYDTAFLFHVLHHCDNPIQVLAETVRCAKRVLVIEDTYKSQLGYWRTEINDCLSNMEFRKHKFRSFGEWKRVIASKKWRLIAGREWWGLSGMLIPTRYCFLVIEGKTESR